MKYRTAILFSIWMICSCKSNFNSNDIYNGHFYKRITSPSDSVKNMYVLYKSTIDSSFSMFKFYWDNGKLQGISYFQNNIKTGPWSRFFDDGKTSFEGSYEMGKKNGEHKTYFANGKLSSVEHYKGDYKTGDWYYYNSDGSLLKTEKYK